MNGPKTPDPFEWTKDAIKESLENAAKRGVKTDGNAIDRAIDVILDGAMPRGHQVWIGYTYERCVTDKLVNGQPVGHFEKSGPVYAPYYEVRNNKTVDIFGGEPALGNPESPDPADLAKALSRVLADGRFAV